MRYSEATYGRILAPYLNDPSNVFVISSDFCHWGSRFSFMFYDQTKVVASFATCLVRHAKHASAERRVVCRGRFMSPSGGSTLRASS